MADADRADADESDALAPAPDETTYKSEPGGVIEPAKDGPTGGWGTAARWFLLALLVIVLVWGFLAIRRF
jgi:hypothetical protein